MQKGVEMFKFFKCFILAEVALVLVGCGAKIEVLPTIADVNKDQHIIYAKFDSNKTYMKKYLPSNIVITDDSPISVEYSFTNNVTVSNTGGDAINIILPIGLFGIPTNNKTLQMEARLRFFDKDKQYSIFLISIIIRPAD